ncbi:MAG: hypothetical protein J6M16_09435 [Clostridia bacterium]|nr:hypothetical protein [Clostridia bacterium]
MFSYESGKKFAIFGVILSFLVVIGGVVLNIILPMVYREAMVNDPLETLNSINGFMNVYYGAANTLAFALMALGFFCMFNEERDTSLLITTAAIVVAALPNIVRIFGGDISPTGIANSLRLEGVMGTIVILLGSVIYSAYIALFAVHSFKNGNAFLGILLALTFIWSAFGFIAIMMVQASGNTYGREASAVVAGIMGIVSFIINVVTTVIKVIHISKDY